MKFVKVYGCFLALSHASPELAIIIVITKPVTEEPASIHATAFTLKSAGLKINPAPKIIIKINPE